MDIEHNFAEFMDNVGGSRGLRNQTRNYFQKNHRWGLKWHDTNMRTSDSRTFRTEADALSYVEFYQEKMQEILLVDLTTLDAYAVAVRAVRGECIGDVYSADPALSTAN